MVLKHILAQALKGIKNIFLKKCSGKENMQQRLCKVKPV
jgi:hypothetical protein